MPIFGLAWLYTDKARDALRLSIPVFVGECVTLAFNLGARLVNTLQEMGILAGDAQPIGGVSPNFDIPAVLKTWAMQMSAGFPLNALFAGKVRPGTIYPVDILCGVMVAGAAVAALTAPARAAKPQAKPAAVLDRPCHAVRTVAAHRAFA